MSYTCTVAVEDPITSLLAFNDGPTVLEQPTALTATVATGSNVAYTWAFGDGWSGAGAIVTHTYAATGTYAAWVTASNSVGALTTTTAVTVNHEPIAGLQASNDSPTELGHPTTLTATITAGSNVTFTWAFGDGEYGSGAVVIHAYAGAGTFTAVVTARNNLSAMTATTVAQVTGPAYNIYLPQVMRNE